MTAVQNDDTPASPWETYCGLTKRELFAAMAMQALASVPLQGQPPHVAVVGDVERAVEYADALLAELAKDGEA